MRQSALEQVSRGRPEQIQTASGDIIASSVVAGFKAQSHNVLIVKDNGDEVLYVTCGSWEEARRVRDETAVALKGEPLRPPSVSEPPRPELRLCTTSTWDRETAPDEGEPSTQSYDLLGGSNIPLYARGDGPLSSEPEIYYVKDAEPTPPKVALLPITENGDPTILAVERLKYFVDELIVAADFDVPKGVPSPDGNGGMTMKWTKPAPPWTQVTLHLPGVEESLPSISMEGDDGYDVINDATPDLLAGQLDWPDCR